MKIEVYKSVGEDPPVWGSPIKTFTNDGWSTPGEGACMEVYYANDLNLIEDFKFELSIWLPDVGGVFGWVLIDTPWEFQDENCPNPGTDGVVDFVLGDCDILGVDFHFASIDCPAAFDQGFETDIVGWIDEKEAGWEDYGIITRTASVNSSEGDYHSVFEGKVSGPFTRFDGYTDSWPGTWVAELDVYLDPVWTDGEAFDYSVAANGTNGAHLQDFIFNVVKDISNSALYVAASNNSYTPPRQDLETINHYEITAAGWFTLQHVFYDNGGVLSVDMNLLDDGGNVLWTETRTDPTNLIPSVVGGNRYGWFPFINVAGGIMIDETQLLRSCN